jgi:uncharacterized protein (DUF58 family)
VKRITYWALRLFSALNHFLSERLTPAGWLVLAGAGTVAAIGIDTTRTVGYQAFGFLAALIAVSFAAAQLFRPRVSARRELPRYATAGERCEYRVVVENLGRGSLEGVTLREALRDPRPGYHEWRRAREPGEERRNWFDRNQGYFRWRWLIERRTPQRSPEQWLETVAPGERRAAKLWLVPPRRGRFELAGLQLARRDPLGLVRGLALAPLPDRIIALPRRYRLPPLALAGRRRFQQGGVTLATSVGDSEEFIGLRDYRPGDPLQRVHWKSTARSGALVVKEYQDEFFERHALVLDTAIAGTDDASFEEAVSVAASFVYAIDTRECLLDLLFVGGEMRTYTAGRGQMQLEHMLEVLAGVQMSEAERFGELARAVLAQRARLASCVLVLLAWDEARRSLVQALRRSGLEARVLVVSDQNIAAGVDVVPLRPGTIQAGLAGLK